jgi:hypothetical protein
LAADGEADVSYDDSTDKFNIDGDVAGDFNLDVVVSDDNGDYSYSTNDVALADGADISFDVDQINSEGDALTLQVDQNGDGTFDSQSDVPDDNTSVITDPAVAEEFSRQLVFESSKSPVCGKHTGDFCVKKALCN